MLAWQLSNTLDGIFCLDALRQALSKGRPKIFNTDQGAQFTADAFSACPPAANIQVNMDGRARALDNVFCERLWRSVKYENIYLQQYDSVRQLQAGLSDDFDLYNHQSPHQSPDYRTPAQERCVLCWRQTARCRSEPAASVWMHLIFPIPWSKHWDPLQSPRHQQAQKTVSSPKSDKSKFRPLSPTPYPLSPTPPQSPYPPAVQPPPKGKRPEPVLRYYQHAYPAQGTDPARAQFRKFWSGHSFQKKKIGATKRD